MCQWTIPLHECGHPTLEDMTRDQHCEHYIAYRNILAHDGGVLDREARLTDLLIQCEAAGRDWFVLSEGVCLECRDLVEGVVEQEDMEEDGEMEMEGEDEDEEMAED